MDISTIQCFVSVARCLNFTKAARECHITQTAMSKKINSLENELGAALFYRDNRQVELTPAGIEFLSRTGVLLEAYADAVYHTQNVANGFESSLKLGIGVYEHLILHNVLSQYASVFPKADIICSQFLYKALAEHLNDRLIDVIISTDQYLQQIPNAEYIVLDERPWRFICSRKHPLASRDNIRLSEFSKECFITMNDGTDEQIRRNYIPHGFTFRRFYRVNSYNTKLLMTRAGLGVSVVPQFVVPYLPKDLCPLDTSPAYRVRKFVAAWLRDNNNPAVKNFTDILASAIGQPDFLQSPPPKIPCKGILAGVFIFILFKCPNEYLLLSPHKLYKTHPKDLTMSAKTKIVVLRMKEIIYTAIFIGFALLLILLLFIMFRPKKDLPVPESSSVSSSSVSSIYTPGLYSASIVLGSQNVNVEVTVSSDRITSVSLVPLSDSVATMYPLMQPAMDTLAEQILANQSLEGLEYPAGSQYTSMALVNAIQTALEKAAAEPAA